MEQATTREVDTVEKEVVVVVNKEVKELMEEETKGVEELLHRRSETLPSSRRWASRAPPLGPSASLPSLFWLNFLFLVLFLLLHSESLFCKTCSWDF